MNLMMLLSALRKGRSLPNPTGWKWFGVASTVGALALVSGSMFAVSRGWLREGIDLDTALNLSGAALALLIPSIYSQVATTDKIGLPADPGDDVPAYRRMQSDRVADVSTGSDAGAGSRAAVGRGSSGDDALGNFRGE